MKFRLQNIGIIKDTEIELNDFTVLCGKNNTGKTYVTYAIYGFLRKIIGSYHNLPSLNREEIQRAIVTKQNFVFNIKNFITDLKNRSVEISQYYTSQLHEIFSSNPDVFHNSLFEYIPNLNISQIVKNNLTIKTDDFLIIKNTDSEIVNLKFRDETHLVDVIVLLIQNHLFNTYQSFLVNYVFILSAERTSTLLFQKELDKQKNMLINELKTTRKTEELALLLENKIARYALPLEHNIDFVRDFENIEKQNSFLKEKHPELMGFIEEILGVNYQIVNGRLLVVDKKNNVAIPSYLASTSVRSLFLLHLWLKHQAQEGDLLMIDEPELNLHPEAQIQLTHLLVRLVNVGIKVWITTHSDYIIKELNNQIMLSNNFTDKAKILNDLGYTEQDVLQKEKINFYVASGNGNFEKIDIDEYGVSETTFDETIVDINKRSNTLISLTDNLLNG